MSSKRYDWQEIQKYYDSGKTWREIIDHFGVSMHSLHKAQKRGSFISRGRSDAQKLSCKNNPRTHTEETKKKLSQIRIDHLQKHPDQVPYLLNHYSKGSSYPEKYFESVFRKEGISLVHHHQIGSYQLDFADIDKKIDIEIDGEQHYVDMRVVKSDKRRTKWLDERGWTCYRIRWSDYQKMSLDDRREVISEVHCLIEDE